MFKVRVIPCLDVKDGRVVKGVNFVNLRDAGDPVEAAIAYDAAGADELTFLDITASSDDRDILLHVVEAVVYTDIGRDGMMSGVNVDATVKLAQALRIPVIASGGIASIKDVEAVCKLVPEGIIGAIAGRALYEGKLDLKKAQAAADQATKKA